MILKYCNSLKDTSSSKSKVKSSADFMFESLSTVAYVNELSWGFSIDKNLHISSSSRIFLYRNKDENTIATFQILLRKSADVVAEAVVSFLRVTRQIESSAPFSTYLFWILSYFSRT